MQGRLEVRIGIVCALALLAGMAWPAPAQGTGAQSWQPPPPPKSWKSPEVKGYTDGVRAGWLDLDAGAKAHPGRQLLYRQPPSTIALDQRYFYREGFRKGYDAVYAHHRREEKQAQTGKS